MKEIVLHGKNGSGKLTLIDDEDYEMVSLFRWHVNSDGYARYTFVNIDGSHYNLMLHRLIANTPHGMYTDHRNHDVLDNRKSNLRICTVKQNGMNRRHRYGSSKFKGVCRDEHGWRSRIQVDKKKISLGYYKDEIDAAKAYNSGAIKYFGEFANLNII